MSLQASSRRQFLSDVGRGMLIAGMGAGAVTDLGLMSSRADESAAKKDRLKFGTSDRLVDLLQTTMPDRLLPLLMAELKSGTTLKDLVAATALANARAFGGEDYIGFHTFMALAPALAMSRELPAGQQALPVFKVLYRHSSRLHARGVEDTLHPVDLPPSRTEVSSAQQLREAVHRQQWNEAEQSLAAACFSSADDAWNSLIETVQEAPEVHRIVLAHRAWDMLELVGEQHAQTMLRQSLHYCLKQEHNRPKYFGSVPVLLEKVLEKYHPEKRTGEPRTVDAAWIDRFSQLLFRSSEEQAAEAVAEALVEGIPQAAISEAVSLAANQLVLRDIGRTEREVQPGKPLGSVHGDSIGVHASDSAHAWRHIARFSNPRNAAASLILAGYQVAKDRISRGGNFLEWQPRPDAARLEKITATTPEALLTQLDGVIREKDQEQACAVTQKYCDLKLPARGLFDVLLQFAISEDGALHAEKYYRTVSDEYSLTSPAFRDRQLVALARVTASASGQKAPGCDEARKLLQS